MWAWYDDLFMRGVVVSDQQTQKQGLKRRVDRILNPGDDDSKTVDTFIIMLITLNVLAVILETEQDIAQQYAKAFQVFEWFSSIFFAAEYGLRLWTCTLREQFAHPVKGRIRYAFTFMAMVDLVAILPFFLPMLGDMVDLRVARAIRLLRLVRLLKMGRYDHAVRTMIGVFARKKEEFAMSGFVLVMVLILCSSVIYFVEHEAQPEAFSSIPTAMWWAVITITSVGYGDVYPVTTLGRFVGAIIAVIGVCVVAMPTGILASGFAEQMRENRGEGQAFGYCPHCGENLKGFDDP